MFSRTKKDFIWQLQFRINFLKTLFANHFEYCLVHFNIILHILLRRIRCSHSIHNTIYKNVNHDTEIVFLKGFRHANTNKTQEYMNMKGFLGLKLQTRLHFNKKMTVTNISLEIQKPPRSSPS